MRYPADTIKGNLFPPTEAGGGAGSPPGGLSGLALIGIAYGLSDYAKEAAEDLMAYLQHYFAPPHHITKLKHYAPAGYSLAATCPKSGDTWVELPGTNCWLLQFANVWDPETSAPEYIHWAETVGNKYSTNEAWQRDEGTTSPAEFLKTRVLPYEAIDPFTEADNLHHEIQGIETKAPPRPLRNPARIHPIPMRKLSAYGAIQYAGVQGSVRGNRITLPISLVDAFPALPETLRRPSRSSTARRQSPALRARTTGSTPRPRPRHIQSVGSVSVFDALPDVKGTARARARRTPAGQAIAIRLPKQKARLIPGIAARVVPARNTREKKIHVSMFGQTLTARAFGQLTEALDLIDCLYEGIPQKLSPRDDRPIFGSTDYRKNFRTPFQSQRGVPIYGYNPNSAQKAQAVFDHWRSLDWERTIAACLTNQAIDMAGGTLGRILGKTSAGLGLPVGLQTLKSVLKI